MKIYLKELLDRNKLQEFWPTKYQTSHERLFAISRFILYSSLIIAIKNQDVTPILVALSLIVMICF